MYVGECYKGGHNVDGCDLALTLCKDDLRKGDLFICGNVFLKFTNAYKPIFCQTIWEPISLIMYFHYTHGPLFEYQMLIRRCVTR